MNGVMEISSNSATQDWIGEAIEDVLDDLFGAALRLCRNKADAEDLVSDAIEKAIRNLGSLQSRDKFRPWIFRILTNGFYTECRKRKVRQETSLSEYSEDDDEEFWLFDKLHQPFLLWWGNPEQEFVNKLLREDLIKAMDELPENFRVVLVLSELDGFSYNEIASIVDVPIGTVRSRLSRARSMMQKSLWQYSNVADEDLAPNRNPDGGKNE